jgi:hypothetical protein
MLFKLFDPLRIEVDSVNKLLKVHYTPKGSRVYYDICDVKGKILLSGLLQESDTRLDLSRLKEEEYVLLVLDGNHIKRKLFRWKLSQIV